MKKQLMALAASTAMVFSLVACSTSAPANEPLVRDTQYGQIKGVDQEGVEVYYGIPYGKEPVGDLRWQAPQDPDAWEDVKSCEEKEQIALQTGSVTDEEGNSKTEVMGTTDALTLDIYTTADAQNCPVVVYVHGGNNQTGSSFEIPGNDMVTKDGIVYVSINYRLGLLGFNNLPALLDDENNTGNFAMLDIAKSLQWVRDNIANFGGDAANVTVSGFSAGGRDVMAMLISPIFEGLFDKAIAYSGGMTIANTEDSQKMIAATMAPLVVEDGKAADEEAATAWLLEDTEEVKEYLYGLDANRVAFLFPNAGIRMAKFPHLYNDGVVLPEGGFENATYVNDVPLMMITGSEEFTMFGLFDPTASQCKDAEGAARFITYYGGEFYRTFNTQRSAEKMDANYNSDMFLCQINYGDSNSKCPIPMLGAFHGIFVPMLSSTNGYTSFYDFSEPGYVAMSDVFNEYFKNFVTTGVPTSEKAGVDWTAWTMDSQNTLILDAADEQALVSVENVNKSNEEIIKEIEADELNEEDKLFIVQNNMNGRWFSADLDAHFKTPSLWK